MDSLKDNTTITSANQPHDEEADEKQVIQERRVAGVPRAISRPGDEDIDNLLANNRQWVEKMRAEDPDFFVRLGKGQAPKYLYIGCSDSRVPANQILGLEPGQVFVHRNVGNLMPVSDLNSLSVLEFAVGVLGVKHIIVTGHYDCGAVKAACKQQDHGLLECWLRNIRDVYRHHRDQVDMLEEETARHRLLVELNVVEQCLNIHKTSVVQRKRLESFKQGSPFVYPRVHAMVFDPSVGVLNKLRVSFKKQLQEYSHIYNVVPDYTEKIDADD